ncbi:hypothetical protein MMC14_001860 [Varicellaria rhodocarpa]|nr:hypothetical protein [Varicellaria rhodocarpa]
MGLPMDYFKRGLDSDSEEEERRQPASKRVKKEDNNAYSEDEYKVVENEAEDTIVVANPGTRSHFRDMFLEPYEADDDNDNDDDDDVDVDDGAVHDDTSVWFHAETVENLLIAPPEREEQMRRIGLIARDDLIDYEEFRASVPLVQEREGIAAESQELTMAQMAAIYRAEHLIAPPTCQDPPAVQSSWGYIRTPTAEEEDEEEEEFREALHAHY